MYISRMLLTDNFRDFNSWSPENFVNGFLCAQDIYHHLEWLRHHCTLWFILLAFWGSFLTVWMSLFHLSSCVRRYHVYKDVWTASTGAVLQCEQESGNSKDTYAVAVQKYGLTVGHVPHRILPLLRVCLVRWLNSMHDYWSVDYSSWQSTVLK